MTEKDSNYDTSNSISHNFAQSSTPSQSKAPNVSNTVNKSNSSEVLSAPYNEDTIHKVYSVLLQLNLKCGSKLTNIVVNKNKKTILVGDSGVGKTSVLVQFDQGKFQSGSFSATVGIGFTVIRIFHYFVSTQVFFLHFNSNSILNYLCKLIQQKKLLLILELKLK